MAVRHEARLVHFPFRNPPKAHKDRRTLCRGKGAHKVGCTLRTGKGAHEPIKPKAKEKPKRTRSDAVARRSQAHKVKKSQSAQGRTLSPEVANAQGAHKVLTDMVWEQ